VGSVSFDGLLIIEDKPHYTVTVVATWLLKTFVSNYAELARRLFSRGFYTLWCFCQHL